MGYIEERYGKIYLSGHLYIKQATCINQACVHTPKKANTLKCTCIKQAPVLTLLRKDRPILYGTLAVLGAIGLSKQSFRCLLNKVGLYMCATTRFAL